MRFSFAIANENLLKQLTIELCGNSMKKIQKYQKMLYQCIQCRN